jgi:hypothetical protein
VFDARRAGLAMALVVAFAYGCGPSGTASVAPSPSPSQVASPSASPSAAAESPSPPAPSPSPSVVAADALCAHEFTTCEIAAGTYSTAPFVHPFSFTVAEAWQNNRAWPHGGEIAQPIGGFDWISGLTSGNGGTTNATLGVDPDPAAFIQFLKSLGGLTVSGPTDVTIGGLAAQQLDVETSEQILGILQFPEDAWNVDVGEKIRFFVLEIEGDTVVLIVDAYTVAAFDDFVALTQPLVDSITWE